MPKDKLFHTKQKASDFKFDARVANVFDDMLVRSVPFYAELQRMLAEQAAHFAKPKTRIYDLGCSTGTTLINLMHAVKKPGVTFVGVDNSPSMLDKTRENVQKFRHLQMPELVEGDLNSPEFKLENASVCTMTWTLQFVRPMLREKLLRKIVQGLVKGGVLILCEKVLVDPSELNRLYIELYYDFKRRNGYSELEIAKKREALENVLLPYKVEENAELLKAAGFSHVDVFFRWYNWAGFIAIK